MGPALAVPVAAAAVVEAPEIGTAALVAAPEIGVAATEGAEVAASVGEAAVEAVPEVVNVATSTVRQASKQAYTTSKNLGKKGIELGKKGIEFGKKYYPVVQTGVPTLPSIPSWRRSTTPNSSNLTTGGGYLNIRTAIIIILIILIIGIVLYKNGWNFKSATIIGICALGIGIYALSEPGFEINVQGRGEDFHDLDEIDYIEIEMPKPSETREPKKIKRDKKDRRDKKPKKIKGSHENDMLSNIESIVSLLHGESVELPALESVEFQGNKVEKVLHQVLASLNEIKKDEFSKLDKNKQEHIIQIIQETKKLCSEMENSSKIIEDKLSELLTIFLN